METQSTLLTWMVFTPLLGMAAIVVLTAARRLAGLDKKLVDQGSRWIALVAAAVPLGLGMWLYSAYDRTSTALQFVHHFSWIPAYNIEYFVAVDGTSVSLILLSTLVSFIATIASMPWWNGKGHFDEHHFTQHKVPGYFAMLLLLQTGMTGTFASLDFFLFYVFWEVMLLPMYFLIGIWGGPRKEYAAIKFFLYTLAGSVLMLLAIIALYYQGPMVRGADGLAHHTFNMIAMRDAARHYLIAPAILGFKFTHIVWVGLFIGFAIKVPMFPFHTWLPDAHVEAPTPISVILAGVLLKMGTYGMLRVNWAILPEATKWAAPAVATLGAINIVYAAFVCMAQRDLKKLIAYSSVSHMGFCLLGMAALTPQAVEGAVLQMFTHGIVASMLFLIVGVIYDRAHHRNIEGFGGLAQQVPEYTAMMGVAFFASMGLPGLAGFVGEFLVFSGAFPVYQGLTIISLSSVVITAGYYLWTIQRVFLGKLNEKYKELLDLNWRERMTLYPLGVLSLVLGFYPQAVLSLVHTGMSGLLGHMSGFSP